MAKKRKFTVLDLFSGCGGLSQGFSSAGFKIIAGIDNDPAALKTFEKNHKRSQGLNLDLADKKFTKNLRYHVKERIDVIAAGPPCQGFSLTGPRNFDDERNKLYLAVIDAVSSLKPKAFLIENVPGLARLYGGQIKDEIIKRFNKLGYNVSMQILCAADYGVPQLRKRVFFIGIKKKYGRFVFPAPTHVYKSYISCAEAICDLPSRETDQGLEIDCYTNSPKSIYQELMRGKSNKLYNHVASKHTDYVKSVISLVPEGKDFRSLPQGVGDSRRFNEAWTRYHGDKPSHTIDTGHRNHFHYKYNRIPTVRENARLQSFPDNFIFIGTRTQQNRQVGNAVPPLLAFALAKQIKRTLEKYEKN